VKNVDAKSRVLPSDEQYQEFATRFVDAILDPRQPWLCQYILVNGFPPVPSWDQIGSGALAVKMREAIDTSFLAEEWLYAAIDKNDRETLVARFSETAKQRELTKDELSRLLACTDFKQLKKSLKGLAKPFKFRPGPSRPTPGQYDKALRYAEILHPALLQLLDQQSKRTSNGPREILTYLAKDFPEACAFLLDNLTVLGSCLRDESLLTRAKTRVGARARVLADAVAGSIHLERRPTTALEYVRTERRKRRKSSR
jgi:hypothetical protein